MKIDQHGSWKVKAGSLAGVALLAVLVGCGGNNSPSAPIIPANVVVSVTPASVTIQTGSTQQFSATVTGTANTAVTWAVDNVTGGSNTTGTISTTGLYTAPATVPTPSKVTVSAMSAADATQSASASLTVTGTIETATQTITAANGGILMLPSGSSVTVPAGAFALDATVTASLVTSAPVQPPNSAMVSVGPAFVLSSPASPFNTSSGNIQFVINTTTNTTGLQGSAPMADLIDSTGDNFFGLAGSFDSNTNLATIIVPVALMNGTKSVVASMVNLSSASAGQSSAATETRSSLFAAATEPPVPGQLLWDGAAWVPYPGNCPTAPGSKILVLVHGMGSSVEQAFSDKGPDGAAVSCVNPIKQAGNYAQVVGFDYDFTSDIAKNSGPSFANFLNTLAACGDQIDIDAHSEGGPVAAYGITQAQTQAQGLIKNFIGLGNPWNGTPLANVRVIIPGFEPLPTALLNLPLSDLSFKGATIQSWLTGPFAPQLLTPGSPLSDPGVLDTIQQTLGQRAPHLSMILACGTQPRFNDLTRLATVVASLFGSPIGTPNDGLVGLNSCQGLAPSAATGNPESVFAGITPQLLMPYALSHVQLPCNPGVIAAVGKAVNSGGPGPLSFNLTVGTTGTGSGTVTPNPVGTSCGAGCYSYSTGTPVLLTAAAHSGSTFAGWSGAGCSGNGVCNVTMSQNQSVTADFELSAPQSFNLIVSITGTGSGTVTPDPVGTSCGPGCYSYSASTPVQLTAMASTGSTFAGWSGAGCSGKGVCNVTMSQNQTVTATFTLSSSQQIGVNGANVSYLGGSVSCSNTGGFFDNCSGTVSLDIETPIENGVVGVTMDQLTFAGANTYSTGTVPGQVVFSISGPILQGTCTAGVINTDIVVLDGFANSTNVTIGLATPPTSSVPLSISCGPGT